MLVKLHSSPSEYWRLPPRSSPGPPKRAEPPQKKTENSQISIVFLFLLAPLFLGALGGLNCSGGPLGSPWERPGSAREPWGTPGSSRQPRGTLENPREPWGACSALARHLLAICPCYPVTTLERIFFWRFFIFTLFVLKISLNTCFQDMF